MLKHGVVNRACILWATACLSHNLTVVIQTVYSEGVTLTHDNVQHTPHHNIYAEIENIVHVGVSIVSVVWVHVSLIQVCHSHIGTR